MAQESNQVSRDSANAPATSATAPSSSMTTTELRAQIERTRAEMSHTIDAIQERLSPARLLSDAKQSVRDATVGRVKQLAATMTVSGSTDRSFDAKRVAYAVRTNPMPFAIAGIAVTAVIARALMRSRGRSRLSSERSAAPSAEQPRALPNRFRGDKRRLLISGCAAGLGCWSAWRARNAGRSDRLKPAL